MWVCHRTMIHETLDCVTRSCNLVRGGCEVNGEYEISLLSEDHPVECKYPEFVFLH